MIMLSPSDKFEIKCDGATFIVSPYTREQEVELEKCIQIVSGNEVLDEKRQQKLVFKFCVKSITGVKRPDGTDFIFDFKDGVLSDEHAEMMVMNVSSSKVFLGLLSLRMGRLGNIKTTDGSEVDMEIKYLGN